MSGVDHYGILLAARSRALTVAVCTTGSTTLAATGSTYTRAAGSFITDGFREGMEVTPAGFSDTTPRVITSVTATVMTVNGTPTAQVAASGRTLSVGMPTTFVSEGKLLKTRVTGVPHVVEFYVPGGAAKRGVGANGYVELLPTYGLQLWGPDDTGAGALASLADALLRHLKPETQLTLGSGEIALVRTQPAPSAAPRTRLDDGWSVITLSFPLRLTTSNAS